MNKNTWAKLFGWIGGLAVAGAQTNVFGKYNGAVGGIGSILVGLGVHAASDTSAGHPDGAATVKADDLVKQ